MPGVSPMLIVPPVNISSTDFIVIILIFSVKEFIDAKVIFNS